MDAAFGMSSGGQQITEGNALLLLCVILPALVTGILFVKKIKDKASSASVVALTAADILVWILFYTGVKKEADANYCTAKATGWYVVNMIAMIVLIAFAVLIYKGRIYYDGFLLTTMSNEDARRQVGQLSKKVTNSVSKIASDLTKDDINPEDLAGYCPKCGSPLTKGSKFCNKCGNDVSSIVKPEESDKSTINVPSLAEPDKVISIDPANDDKERTEE